MSTRILIKMVNNLKKYQILFQEPKKKKKKKKLKGKKKRKIFL